MAEAQPNSRLETFCDGVFAIALIYNAVTALQAVGWILVSGAALRDRLTKDEKSTSAMRNNRRNGYFALVTYSFLALIAFWFPLGIAIVTSMLWAYWLAIGLREGRVGIRD